jgi:putative membrane protein
MNRKVLAAFAFIIVGFFISIGYSAVAQTPRITPAPNAQANAIDRQFVLDAGQAGLGNIMLGQLALQRSNNPNVRSFAQAEINEQTQVKTSLQQIVPRLGLSLPTAPGPRQQAIMARMRQLSGAQFDRAYLDEGGVNAHLENAAIFQREAAFGQSPDLTGVANKGLPTINQHFTTASSLTNYRFAQVPQRYNDASRPGAAVPQRPATAQ